MKSLTVDLASAALADLTPEDLQLFVQFGVGESQQPPFECVHHAFESFAKSQPTAIAVEHLGKTITYGDLDISSSRLARKLQSNGVYQG